MSDRGAWLRDERGATVVLVALAMVALMGMAGLAIDLGMLQKTRAEAQRTADAAALAGASAFLLPSAPGLVYSDIAVSRAKTLADTNYMAGAKIDTASEVSVAVDLPARKVTVTVRRAAIPTWFARIFGLNSFPVGARAAAEADTNGEAGCVKPLGLVDLWVDSQDAVANGGNGNALPDGLEKWDWNGNPPDDYRPYNPGDPIKEGTGLYSRTRPADTANGVGDRDVGRLILLRGGNGNDNNGNSPKAPSYGQAGNCPGIQGTQCIMPGWWALWGPWDNVQGKDLDRWIRPPNAPGDCMSVSIDSTYYTDPGFQGSLASAYDANIDADKDARWDPKLRQVVGTDPAYGNWMNSPRVWIVAVLKPSTVPPAPNSTIKFHNFARVFFEGCENPNAPNWKVQDCKGGTTDLVVRFLGSWAPGPGSNLLVKNLRLVE